MKSALLVTVVLIAACGVQSSGIDSSASVTISGKAMDADGHPLADTKVVLVKELDLGEAIGGLFVTTVSLGLACLADHPPALCQNNSHTATTDGSGSFSFSVKGSDTQGSFGIASTMEVVTRVPADANEVNGPSALMEFTVQTASLTLPDLRIWRPTTGWGSDRRSVWTSLPGSYGSSPVYNVELYDLRGDPWWVTGPAHSGDKIDGRILEDMRGSFDVAAHAHGTANGTTVDYTYVSGSVGLIGYMGAPPSRGAQCAPVTASGAGSFAPCPLTTGPMGGAPQLSGASSGVAIDLGLDRPLSLIVVRGCTAQCKLAMSSDLATWSDAGIITGMYATAPVTLDRSARYVRVDGSPSISSLRQISAW